MFTFLTMISLYSGMFRYTKPRQIMWDHLQKVIRCYLCNTCERNVYISSMDSWRSTKFNTQCSQDAKLCPWHSGLALIIFASFCLTSLTIYVYSAFKTICYKALKHCLQIFWNSITDTPTKIFNGMDAVHDHEFILGTVFITHLRTISGQCLKFTSGHSSVCSIKDWL